MSGTKHNTAKGANRVELLQRADVMIKKANHAADYLEVGRVLKDAAVLTTKVASTPQEHVDNLRKAARVHQIASDCLRMGGDLKGAEETAVLGHLSESDSVFYALRKRQQIPHHTVTLTESQEERESANSLMAGILAQFSSGHPPIRQIRRD